MPGERRLLGAKERGGQLERGMTYIAGRDT